MNLIKKMSSQEIVNIFNLDRLKSQYSALILLYWIENRCTQIIVCSLFSLLSSFLFFIFFEGWRWGNNPRGKIYVVRLSLSFFYYNFNILYSTKRNTKSTPLKSLSPSPSLEYYCFQRRTV